MRIMPALVLAALLLAGCSKPSASGDITVAGGGAPVGGGAVADVPATFSGFTAAPTSVANDGSGTVVFAITVNDTNTETDISSIEFFSNASGLSLAHTITVTERAAASEPASYTGGWKAWTGASAVDGVLFAKLQYPVPNGAPAGAYVLSVRATNPTGVVSYPVPLQTVTINVHAPTVVAVASAPVNLTGVAQTGISWGNWSANPGDANSAGTNFLKLTNTGSNPNPSVIVDFTQSVFTGASDANYTINITNNVQFSWWEDVSGSAKPNAGTFNWLPTSPDGSVTIAFTGTSHVIFVKYRIVALPSVLPVQSYTASFTATDL